MKKIFLSVAVAALTTLAVSCGGSVDSKIDKLNYIADEMVTAAKDGDADELKSLSEEFKSVAEELEKEDLTEEQKKEVQQAAIKVVGAAIGAAASGVDFD